MQKLETTTNLLDALQERYGWTSDNQVAAGLGIPQATVSCWRRGRNYPTEVHAIKIAKALGMEPLHVLAIAAADRSTDEKTRKEWLAQIARGIASGFFTLPVLAGTCAELVARGCILGQIGDADRSALPPAA